MFKLSIRIKLRAMTPSLSEVIKKILNKKSSKENDLNGGSMFDEVNQPKNW